MEVYYSSLSFLLETKNNPELYRSEVKPVWLFKYDKQSAWRSLLMFLFWIWDSLGIRHMHGNVVLSRGFFEVVHKWCLLKIFSFSSPYLLLSQDFYKNSFLYKTVMQPQTPFSSKLDVIYECSLIITVVVTSFFLRQN